MKRLLLAVLLVSSAFSMENLSEEGEVKVTLTIDGQEKNYYKNYGDTIDINGEKHMISLDRGVFASSPSSSKKWTLQYEPRKKQAVHYNCYAIDATDWHYLTMPNGHKVYMPVKPCEGSPYEQGYEEELERLKAQHSK